MRVLLDDHNFNMTMKSIVLLLSVIFLQSVLTAGHPCKRTCMANAEPFTCTYNFTVESYRTLSKACYQCPFVQSDCFRPHCVSGDGVRKALISINRQVPGPAIEVCEGDTVVVMVTNDVDDGISTSIHWHGIHQRGTPFMDGVGGITQCNIGMKETFRYEFKADPAGTHWYHSHTGLQLADGLFGPIIIRQPLDLDPGSSLYDVDDHIVLVGDWLPVLSIDRFSRLMHDTYDNFLPKGLHVNGRGRNADVMITPDIINRTATSVKTPLEVFRVDQGKKYRFRFIGSSGDCPVEVSVEAHILHVLASDGHPVKSRPIDKFVLHPGERYDFMLEANKDVGNYWIRVIGLDECAFTNVTVGAVLRYNTAPEVDPETDFESLTPGEIILNPILTEDGTNDTIVSSSDLENTGSEVNLTGQVVDKQLYIGMRFLNNDNTKYNNKELYPVQNLSDHRAHFTPAFDNITFLIPPIPVLTQPEDVDESWFCNRSTIMEPDACLNDLCLCTHTIRFNLGENIEMILISEAVTSLEGHAVHLHGHNFHVIGSGKFRGSITRDEIMRLDSEGTLERNYINPPKRDTIMVQSGGYVILRFKADNPGYWLMHCHTDSHLAQGKALLIKTGDYSDFPKVPSAFPKCGGWGYSHTCKKEPDCRKSTTNDAVTHHRNLSFPLAIILLLSVFYSKIAS